MQEVNFKDRVPKYPGRITLEPVAGAVNTYTMTRADEPTEAGTPLDKATFNSIIHSRLTGRYYSLTATQTFLTTESGTANPIPTSWNSVTTTSANSGGYSVSCSGSRDEYATPNRAFDGATNTSWESNVAKSVWLRLDVPDGLIVNKMKIAFNQYESYSTTTLLQGLTEAGAWVTLLDIPKPSSTSVIEYTLTNSTVYVAYRLHFTFLTETNINVYEWQISSWKTTTTRYNYFVTGSTPGEWTTGQRITVRVPSFSIAGVTQNTLNGVSVNTILQPNKRYELVYNGSSFDAKEV